MVFRYLLVGWNRTLEAEEAPYLPGARFTLDYLIQLLRSIKALTVTGEVNIFSPVGVGDGDNVPVIFGPQLCKFDEILHGGKRSGGWRVKRT